MYKNVLQSIDNIAIWPIISFIIFGLFFLFLILFVWKVDTGYIKYMKNLPVADKKNNETNYEE